jgi:hypothetical protein
VKARILTWFILALPALSAVAAEDKAAYPVVDTGQRHIFSDRGQLTVAPRLGQAYYGQDAFYRHNAPRYRDNKDGTVSDLVTGLMWQRSPDGGGKKTFGQAVAGAAACRTSEYDDWRLPTIKELYSLIDFNGCVTTTKPIPYIDTKHFEFDYGDPRKGDRLIDAQYWSATEYLGTTMGGQATVFGVNFADGRIKGYPRDRGRGGRANTMFVRYVRGNSEYGRNRFVDNEDGTVSDLATGLMWQKADSGKRLNWRHALAYCEGLDLAGRQDWRLPSAKELHSIVDYSRAPDAADPRRRGPAIDPVFKVTDPEAWYWTSTTHLDGPRIGRQAVYIAFGRAYGYWPPRGSRRKKVDVHGAGAQRSDPKSGDPSRYPTGRGPQGDEIRILLYARAVRNSDPEAVERVRPETEKLDLPFARTGAGGPADGKGTRRPPRPRRPGR